MATRSQHLYFDYAASTPVAPQVLRAMQPYFSGKFGNPGSLHSFGQEALAAVDRSREVLGRAVGAGFRQIIFTGSATEANNLALRGALPAKRVIVSAIEHESILETVKDMERGGIEVVRIPVDRQGVIKLPLLAAAINENTALVSVMYANNETGVVQPIAKIAKLVRESVAKPLFHVDAAQAFQFLDCNAEALGIDLMTLSAHKIYGPKGIGALYIGARARVLRALISGGGQEFGLRSGTENVPSIVGFGAAVQYIEEDKAKQGRRIAELKEQFLRGVMAICPKAKVNGSVNGLPHIANVWLPGMSAEDILIRLDLQGIAVSAGSACTARSSQPSYVLRAMGFHEARARESLRVSFGRPTTAAEVRHLLRVISKMV